MVTLRRLRWISFVSAIVLICILSALSVLAVVHAHRANDPSPVPAPLAAGTVLERPRRPMTTAALPQANPPDMDWLTHRYRGVRRNCSMISTI
jgi:hypothetical protein